jgi:hypothetical protein
MKRSRKSGPRYFAGYIHDVAGPQNSILSVCCEGPDCEICAADVKAAKRASNHAALAVHAQKSRA